MAPEKSQGVRPVGIGDLICCLMENLVQAITAHQALASCRRNNLCTRLKSCIDGALHSIKQASGKSTPPNAVLSDSHPEVVNGLETLWEGGFKTSYMQEIKQEPEKSRGKHGEEILSEDLLTQTHRPGDRSNLDKGESAKIDDTNSPLTQESALGTQPVSQSLKPPNTGKYTVAPDPFIGGWTQGALCPEYNLAGCLL